MWSFCVEEMEKIRENMSQVFTTIGVVAALILTMEKTNEVDLSQHHYLLVRLMR